MSESEVRQRTAQAADTGEGHESTAIESDEDLTGGEISESKLEKLTKDLPRASDQTVNWLDTLLSGLPPKWRNWVVRGIFSFVMIFGFMYLVMKGPIALMATVLAIQIKCFSEIIAIGLAVYRVYDLPWFRTLSWYFLLTSNYFFYGESLIDYWAMLLRRDEFLKFLVVYHRFFSFLMYICGFVWFVLSLKKGYYMRQFSLFAWTHVTLLLIVSQSYLIIQNIMQGIIWLLVPVSMIICCDIMSYMFGFFFGRTPLIKLSPKKTWEGFIGGGVSTIIFGVMLTYVLLHYPFFVCPLEYSEASDSFTQDCALPPAFLLREFDLPRPFSYFFLLLRRSSKVKIYPMLGHTVVMGLFATLIGPFGGFFASGFKRAFKIKDFGDIIPGHGGLMDRFDCQLLMGTFVNVYIHSFIRTPNPGKLVQQILFLRPDQQMEVYELLTQKLLAQGLLNSTTVGI